MQKIVRALGMVLLLAALLAAGCTFNAAQETPVPTATDTPAGGPVDGDSDDETATPATATVTLIPTTPPTATDRPTATDLPTVTPTPTEAIITEPVVGWEGTIVGLVSGQYDDYFQISGTTRRYGIDSIDPIIRQQLIDLRDSGAVIRVSGTLRRGADDAYGAQLQVTSIALVQQVTATPAVVSQVVNDWRGYVLAPSPDGYDDYFQLTDGVTRYGIASINPIIRDQIVSLRNSGSVVRVWGTLRLNVSDAYNGQIDVSQLEILLPPTSTPRPITCAPAPRLSEFTSARVTAGLPNVLRSAPGTGANSAILANIPAGAVFRVLDGPTCTADGHYWWEVNAVGEFGWTAEGEGAGYWLEPLICNNGLRARLVPGELGRVTSTPNLPNALRSAPGVGADSAIIGEIPVNGIFEVLAGPHCAGDGKLWWQVDYQGQTGWTAEGDAGVYWLEPLVCGNGLPSRLIPGMTARVTADPNLPNTVRAAPSYGSTGVVLGQIPVGGEFSVLDGPTCDTTGHSWYYVQYGALTGWTGEGEPDAYWLEPVSSGPPPATPTPTATATTPPSTSCDLPTRLWVGYSGVVTPGEANTVRAGAGLDADRIGQLTAGTIFTVIEGPRCADGLNWWRVRSSNLTGWTAEGQGSTYWLEPIACGNGMRSRMVPGLQGRVTFDPPLDNIVRSSPTRAQGSGNIVGEIPPGGQFTVLEGPTCGPAGMAWWRVNYQGLVGWTGEGENGSYWLEYVP